jgi:hypothetical protein
MLITNPRMDGDTTPAQNQKMGINIVKMHFM